MKRIIATFAFARQHNFHCHFVVTREKAGCTDTQKVAPWPFGKYSLFNSITMHCTAVLPCLSDLWLCRWQETEIKVVYGDYVSRNWNANLLQRINALFVSLTCRSHWHGTPVTFYNLCKGHGFYRSSTISFFIMPAQYYKYFEAGLWSRKSHHPTPGNFDYPTPIPTFSCIS